MVALLHTFNRVLGRAAFSALHAGAAFLRPVSLQQDWPTPLGASALSAALWLAEQYPDYFLDNPRGWLARTPMRDRLFVFSVDDRLTSEWVRRRLESIPPLCPRDHVLTCVAAVRDAVLNQRALSAHVLDCFQDGLFWLSTASRLMRGFVNCEGQNHLAALLLAESFDDVALFDLRDPSPRRLCHSLLQLKLDAIPVFADAWSEVPLLRLDAQGVATEEHGIPSHELCVRRGLGEREGIYPRIWYEGGHVVQRFPVLRIPLPLLEQPEAPEPRRDGLTMPEPEPWAAFLRARAHHVFGNASDAVPHYQAALRHNPPAWVRRTAEIMLSNAPQQPAPIDPTPC